jgi:hypothetical protein
MRLPSPYVHYSTSMCAQRRFFHYRMYICADNCCFHHTVTCADRCCFQHLIILYTELSNAYSSTYFPTIYHVICCHIELKASYHNVVNMRLVHNINFLLKRYFRKLDLFIELLFNHPIEIYIVMSLCM